MARGPFSLASQLTHCSTYPLDWVKFAVELGKVQTDVSPSCDLMLEDACSIPEVLQYKITMYC